MAAWLPGSGSAEKPGIIGPGRELSHPSTMANVLFFAAWFHQHRGEWQTVQALVEEGMTLATEHGFSRWLAQTFLQGWLLVERGRRRSA